MSKVEVDAIEPQSGTSLTLGASGDTITIPSGATINNQGTATNFGATGSASWTTTVKTHSPSSFTAVAGEGYFVNTTGGAVTVNLPAGSAGAVVAFKDYAGTFDTNALTISANGSDKIGGSTDDKKLSTEGIAATLIFIDSTQGWLVTDDGLQSSLAALAYSADLLVVAAGGGGGYDDGGAGGAGGYRTSTQDLAPGTVYTVTVGDGGTGSAPAGTQGGDAVISGSGLTTITSTGGGEGGQPSGAGGDGGSGGGGGSASSGPGGAGGPGNTPSTSPAQGTNGGAGNSSPRIAGGGGGATDAGDTDGNGHGGNGAASSITGSAVTRAGGGGGSTRAGTSAEPGGTGGGGNGGVDTPAAGATNGTANTGGGGGGGSGNDPKNGGSGGKGVVIISVPDADYSGTTTGSPTVATGVSGKTVITFNASGSYTG